VSSVRGQRRLAGVAARPVQRRRQILQGMADGLTARQVAHRLGISRRTVEGHLRVLRELTGARSIGELCAVSVAEGWVTPGRLAPGVALGGLGARALAGPQILPGSCPESGWFPDDLIMPVSRLAGSEYPAGAGAPARPPAPAHPPAQAGAGPGRPPAGPARATRNPRAASAARDAAASSDHPGRPGGRPTVMTPDRITAARRLLGAYSVTDTARRLGVSRSTLYAHLAEITASGQHHTAAAGSEAQPWGQPR
jgi:DNA-binding CsgD family transcriptional regulator